jgi:anti-sigma B factor antagonist
MRGGEGKKDAMDLTLESRMHGSWTILHVAGELDLHTSPVLQDRLAELMDEGATRLALELDDVGFMDSSSLGVLVTALKRLRDRNGDLALVGVNGSPLKVLALTGIDRVLTMYPAANDLP